MKNATRKKYGYKVINSGRSILEREKARRIIKYRKAAKHGKPLPWDRIENEGERVSD